MKWVVIVFDNGEWKQKDKQIYTSIDHISATVKKLNKETKQKHMSIHQCFLDCLDLFEKPEGESTSSEVYYY
jgi:hypothetical protein